MWEVAEDCYFYLNKENKPCKPQNFNIKKYRAGGTKKTMRTEF